MTTPRDRLVTSLPKPLVELLRLCLRPEDVAAGIRFLCDRSVGLPFGTRLDLLRRYFHISCRLESPHTHAEILSFARTILTLPKSVVGVIVEAGCFKGSSTAKFSLAADLAQRQLVVFDSFQGLPDHSEAHGRSIFGEPTNFKRGAYGARLDDVTNNVARLGCIRVCRFVKGWFQDTLSGFREPIAAVYIDVDLAASTRACLKHLYPLLQPGGVLYSQDGHLPLVIEVFRDATFWLEQVGSKPPLVEGLGRRKLIRIQKDA